MKRLNVVGRKGAYDDDGNLIIPFDYVEISSLNNGVYYARKNFRESDYHFYTAKGRLDYPKTITNVQWDNEKNLLAVWGKDNTAEIVEVDYESNTLKTIYSNCITHVVQMGDDLLILTCINGEVEVFSRKQKKVIATFDGEKQILGVNERGFICKDETGKSFWNLSGEKILGGFHDIKMYDDFLICIDKALFWKLYSYDGKALNQYEYSGNEYTDGIIPRWTQIDGEKVRLFITNDKIIGSEKLTKKLETADGTCLIWTLEQGAPIVVFEDIGNVILKGKKKQILYKLERKAKGKITSRVLFEADRIKRISKSSEFFEMWRGRKRGICDKDGLLIEPFRWLKYHMQE